jgi:DNA-binding response OmpR family regulator
VNIKHPLIKHTYEAPQAVELTAEAASTRFDNHAIMKMSSETLKMRALILTGDQNLVQVFGSLFNNFKIITHSCSSESEARVELSSHKYEAVVLDFDKFAGVLPTYDKLRENRANKNLVVFAIATQGSRRKAAENGASFIFERPLEEARIAQVLRTAYGLMLRDRRDYFRLGVELPVALRRSSGEVLQCKTINISRSGMALLTPSPFEANETVELNFRVDEMGATIHGTGKIIWDDRHGKAGISFECKRPEQFASFSAWLDNRFYCQFDTSSSS